MNDTQTNIKLEVDGLIAQMQIFAGKFHALEWLKKKKEKPTGNQKIQEIIEKYKNLVKKHKPFNTLNTQGQKKMIQAYHLNVVDMLNKILTTFFPTTEQWAYQNIRPKLYTFQDKTIFNFFLIKDIDSSIKKTKKAVDEYRKKNNVTTDAITQGVTLYNTLLEAYKIHIINPQLDPEKKKQAEETIQKQAWWRNRYIKALFGPFIAVGTIGGGTTAGVITVLTLGNALHGTLGISAAALEAATIIGLKATILSTVILGTIALPAIGITTYQINKANKAIEKLKKIGYQVDTNKKPAS